jgi:3-oxoacyl-[acyl-carrier-protein] synthase-3
MKYSRIIGTGGYLPEKTLTNHDLEKIMDTTDSWIRERTGIYKRHIAAGEENTCDLAEIAATQAMEAAGKTPRQIDLIVFATTTPDRVFPSTACLLQQRLDIHGTAAFDIQAVCTGFVYALAVADKFIKTGAAKCALVVGAETLSRIVNWNDRGTAILFGDGAGAVVLEASDEPGILSTHLHADGSYEHLLTVPSGISQGYDKVQAGEAYVQMQGNEVFKMAVNTLGRIVDETLAANDMEKSDVDWLIPHQANIRIIQATAKKLKMSMDHVVPLALDAAIRDGRIKRGEVLLLEAFGGGFTWGSALVRY